MMDKANSWNGVLKNMVTFLYLYRLRYARNKSNRTGGACWVPPGRTPEEAVPTKRSSLARLEADSARNVDGVYTGMAKKGHAAGSSSNCSNHLAGSFLSGLNSLMLKHQFNGICLNVPLISEQQTR